MKDYTQTSGPIVYLDKQFLKLPYNDKGKYRYISIANYPFMFEIYANKQTANIDKLRIGDKITVYYEEIEKPNSDGVNSLVHFITRNNVAIFEQKGNATLISMCILCVSVLVLLLGFYFYKKEKLQW